jgi:hypothetical protein
MTNIAKEFRFLFNTIFAEKKFLILQNRKHISYSVENEYEKSTKIKRNTTKRKQYLD